MWSVIISAAYAEWYDIQIHFLFSDFYTWYSYIIISNSIEKLISSGTVRYAGNMSFPHFCQNLLHLHLLLYSKALEWDKLKWIYASEQKNSGSNFPEIFLKYSLQKSKLHFYFLLASESHYRFIEAGFNHLVRWWQISVKTITVKKWKFPLRH